MLLSAACATAPRAPDHVDGAAPELTLRGLDGTLLRLSSLRGRPVLLDVFASWCEPCAESLPFYERLADEERARGLVVLAVSVDEDQGALRRFVAREHLTLPVFHDPSGAVARALGVAAMPTLFFLDREGRVAGRHESFRLADRAAIEARAKELLR